MSRVSKILIFKNFHSHPCIIFVIVLNVGHSEGRVRCICMGRMVAVLDAVRAWATTAHTRVSHTRCARAAAAIASPAARLDSAVCEATGIGEY